MKNSKIIYDNIIYSLQKTGGISKYWTELIKRISKKKKITFYELENNNLFRKKINIKCLKETGITFKILRYLPFLKELPSRSIFHSSYLRTSLQKNVINITTIHDFTYEYFEKGMPRFIHSLQKNLSIRRADGIICVSDNTKNDLFKFFPNLNKKKVKRIYNGVENTFFQIRNLRQKIINKKLKNLSQKKIILFVGDRRKTYKNFFLTVDIVNLLKKEFVLVCIGGEKINHIEKNLINNKIPGRFYHFTTVSSEKLNQIYNISFCLVYPSLYEGFGLPVIEAMKAGCPVISTKNSSIKEIAKDAAILINKVNKENFVKSINLINDTNLRNSLIKKGLKRSKIFSWDKCAEETLKFYEEIYKIKFKQKKI